MPIRTVLPILVVLVAGLLPSIGSAAAVEKNFVCGPSRATTIEVTHTSRIFSTGPSTDPRFYGCARAAAGRRWRLKAPLIEGFDSVRVKLDNFSLAARWAGFTWEREATDTNRSGVVLRNLIDGASKASETLVNSDLSWARVSQLRVNSLGDAAWIADGWNGPPLGSAEGRQVVAFDGAGSHLLDEGLSVKRHGLVIGRFWVSWLHGGSSRRAHLR